MERYLRVTRVHADNTKANILLNSLDESVQIDLFSHREYDKHSENFTWLSATLKELYGQKDSTISPRVHLLSIHQTHDQSAHDYAHTLRVEAYRCWPREDPGAKELFLVKAFLHGLRDKQLSAAIKALKPSNLEQAVLLCQRSAPLSNSLEQQGGTVNYIYKMDSSPLGSPVVTNSELQSQISELRKKVTYLESLLMQVQPKQFFPNRQSGGYQPRTQNVRNQPLHTQVPNVIKCFNCNNAGHIARHCPEPIKCRRCGLKGHVSTNCTKGRPQRQYLRHMQENLLTEAGMNDENSILDEQSEKEELETSNSVCIIQPLVPEIRKCRTNEQFRQATRRPIQNFSKEENNAADKWVSYVRGQGKRPKNSQRDTNDAVTLISTSRPEPARNKPLIVGRCAGVKTRLFLDSGAEMNVIDSEYLKGLMDKQLCIKFTKGFSQVQCANGTKMAVIGYAHIPLEIGCAKVIQRFLVVSSLFPKVIVGIRTMKTMDISICPREDCIKVGEHSQVPFVSVTSPQSVGCFMGKETGSH